MINFPWELFEQLPSHDADYLRKNLIAAYFEANPEEMRLVSEKAEGDPNLIDTFQDEKINEILYTDYAYDIETLNRRDNDMIAKLLVEEMDKFNQAEKQE